MPSRCCALKPNWCRNCNPSSKVSSGHVLLLPIPPRVPGCAHNPNLLLEGEGAAAAYSSTIFCPGNNSSLKPNKRKSRMRIG